MPNFAEDTITLLCRQFALEEGWKWDELEDNSTIIYPKSPPWSKTHIRQQIFQILNTFAPETKEETKSYYSSATSNAPIAINHELIEHYMQTQNLPAMLSIFDFLTRCRERAETLSRAYLNQMEMLSSTPPNRASQQHQSQHRPNAPTSLKNLIL